MKAVSLIASGRVQGVYYRASAVEEALRCGVVGWVRNLPNTDVEIWAEGDDASIQQLVAWCKEGPALAHVANLHIEYMAPLKTFDNFTVNY